MDKASIDAFKIQLQQIEQILSQDCVDPQQRQDLLSVKQNIEELLTLTEEDAKPGPSSTLDDEYDKFMAVINGGIEPTETEDSQQQEIEKENDKLNNIHEGMKCRVPHKHKWGDVVYHDAMVVAVESSDIISEPMVTVLYTHPTHNEMLPCPYYYDEKCKFSADKCRYSHGETVSLSDILEYVEPDFGELTIGSYVLAKNTDNLWYKGRIKDVDEEKYFIRLESNKTDIEVLHGDVYPLPQEDNSTSEDDDHIINLEDIINKSLLITPSSQALGSWETYTKGMGSKLMQKMGYIVGTGLGKNAEGRIEPVSAVVLPAGKSLDYCMELMNMDEKKQNPRKKFRHKQAKDMSNMKRCQNENKGNVFDFMNKTLSGKPKDTSSKKAMDEQKEIKGATNRDLNIRTLNLAKKIHGVEIEMEGIRRSLQTSGNAASDKQGHLKGNLAEKQDELNKYRDLVQKINSEQLYRENKKKMTIF